MTTIKESVDLKKQQEILLIRSSINSLLNSIYEGLIQKEQESAENFCLSYNAVGLLNACYNNSVSMTHISYKNLLDHSIQLDNYQNQNINEIFCNLNKQNPENTTVPPFVFVQINVNQLINRNNIDINDIYNNITYNHISDYHRIKVVKKMIKTQTNRIYNAGETEYCICLIIFFDSMNYSTDGFHIFTNNTIVELDESNKDKDDPENVC